MKLFMTTAILAGMAAFPALAQQDPSTMTCADFMAMDQTQQMDAMNSMKTAMASGDMGTATDTTATDTAAADTSGAASTDTTATDTASADTGAASTDTTAATTDTASADTGTAATDADTDTDTATADAGTTSGDMSVTNTETTSADTGAAAGTTGETDPMMAALTTACQADSTMLVKDAWTQAEGTMGTTGTDTTTNQ